jgi:peptidoglycan biosynthesis protein MviN/MurJ (putative lipid II flippase)
MKLYRAFATVGGLTTVSRVLGFARDILIAATLGSGAVADAFFVAWRARGAMPRARLRRRRWPVSCSCSSC